MPRANLRTLEVDTCLCCDSIRKEDNGKLILVGVYQRDMIVAMPRTLSVQFYVIARFIADPAPSIWFRLRVDESEAYSVEIQRTGQSENRKVSDQPEVSLVLPPVEISVSKPLELTVEARDNEDDEWQKCLVLPVKKYSKE